LNIRLFNRMILFFFSGLVLRSIAFYVLQFVIATIILPISNLTVLAVTSLALFIGYILIGKFATLGKSVIVPNKYLDALGIISSALALAAILAPCFAMFYVAFRISIYSAWYGFLFLASYMIVAVAVYVDVLLFRFLLALSLFNFANIGLPKKIVYTSSVIYYILPFLYSLIFANEGLDGFITGSVFSEICLVLLVIFYALMALQMIRSRKIEL